MSRVEWWDLKAKELRSLGEKNAIVIVPVGSIEQHGPHLPVRVDALLAGEIARRTAHLVSEHEPVVVAPVVWSGLAEHHMSFGGTITLDYETFLALLRCVCRSVTRHGFRRIFLLNAHGGNITALGVIVDELTRELGVPIVTCSYWHAAADAFAKILESQTNVLHAGEAESSMLLALKPELVDRSRLSDVGGDFAPEDWGSGAYRWRTFAERTETGVIGDPSKAGPEKGEKLLAAAAGAVADLILRDDIWRESR